MLCLLILGSQPWSWTQPRVGGMTPMTTLPGSVFGLEAYDLNRLNKLVGFLGYLSTKTTMN